MPNNLEKYLPIGSVIKLKMSDKLVMIIGYNIINSDKVFDYMACLYPEGMIDSNKVLAFDQDDIEQVFDYGYSDEQYIKFVELLSNKKNDNSLDT